MKPTRTASVSQSVGFRSGHWMLIQWPLVLCGWGAGGGWLSIHHLSVHVITTGLHLIISFRSSNLHIWHLPCSVEWLMNNLANNKELCENANVMSLSVKLPSVLQCSRCGKALVTSTQTSQTDRILFFLCSEQWQLFQKCLPYALNSKHMTDKPKAGLTWGALPVATVRWRRRCEAWHLTETN